jgi:hypothetical protein
MNRMNAASNANHSRAYYLGLGNDSVPAIRKSVSNAFTKLTSYNVLSVGGGE